MDFTVVITDPAQLDGITWARQEYNKVSPMPVATDEEYIQWVMTQAATSYADQKLRQQYRNEYEQAAGPAAAASGAIL